MRFTWFTTLQGLLFASLGFIWDQTDKPVVLVVTISVLGIIIALSFRTAVKLTRSAYRKIKEWWDNNLEDYDGPPLKGVESSGKMTLERLFRPWRILPWAFIIAWIIILIFRVTSKS